jgi:hypothetical protein
MQSRRPSVCKFPVKRAPLLASNHNSEPARLESPTAKPPPTVARGVSAHHSRSETGSSNFSMTPVALPPSPPTSNAAQVAPLSRTPPGLGPPALPFLPPPREPTQSGAVTTSAHTPQPNTHKASLPRRQHDQRSMTTDQVPARGVPASVTTSWVNAKLSPRPEARRKVGLA